jgi:hypothetical protein
VVVRFPEWANPFRNIFWCIFALVCNRRNVGAVVSNTPFFYNQAKIMMLKFSYPKIPAIVVLSVMMVVLSSFSGDKISFDEIKNAFAKGNAAQLSSFFSSTLNLTVAEESGSYSSRQAKLILQKFFSDHPPKSFIIKNTGTISNNARYMLGTYLADNKDEYSVYVLVTSDREGEHITQITIISN